jgi:hypothetical protein
VIAGCELLLHRARQFWRLLPLRPRLLHELGEAFRCRRRAAVRRDGSRQRFEVADHVGTRRRLRLQIHLIAVLVAIEKRVAGGAEPLPHRVGLRAAHRTDLLPLDLQLPALGGRRFPVGGRRESLGLGAQRFLARQVLGPLVLALLEVVVTRLKN